MKIISTTGVTREIPDEAPIFAVSNGSKYDLHVKDCEGYEITVAHDVIREYAYILTNLYNERMIGK